ncbi:hypothetical protein MRB53_033228 [Persea americana]|uniref:Uncharacterized protein n=1 Tax=Persea americana TaxID=3435 RepID=A0ACC2KUP4_PERAE|nr:hypothetical protein MRB53_033228 [Persea americana]
MGWNSQRTRLPFFSQNNEELELQNPIVETKLRGFSASRCSPEILFTVVVASRQKCFSIVGRDNRRKEIGRSGSAKKGIQTWVLGIARSRRRKALFHPLPLQPSPETEKTVVVCHAPEPD